MENDYNPMYSGSIDKETILNEIKTFNWSGVRDCVAGINVEGPWFGEHANRFIKEKLLSKSIETASDDKCFYVNKVGYDFIFGNLKIESKSERNLFFKESLKKTKKNPNPTPRVKDDIFIQLKNLNRIVDNNLDSLKSNLNFDILLMIDTSEEVFCAGLMFVDEIEESMLSKTEGQIKAKIPRNKIKFIYGEKQRPAIQNLFSAEEMQTYFLEEYVAQFFKK